MTMPYIFMRTIFRSTTALSSMFAASVLAQAVQAEANAATLAETAQDTSSSEGSPASVSARSERALDTDIIVTARKRDETSIAVPVAITVVSGTELERRGIVNMDALARIVPSLVIGDNGGQQGGIVAIRGLAGADTNPFGDQAVSFNIDGVQVARSSIRRMSEMDMAQIEVLKGPQALFFGKNSPAGIISVRTADPTAALQAKLAAGYEFNADEIRTDGYIAGPISDTIGFRIAAYYSDMKGWVDNIGPRAGPGVFPSNNLRSPNGWEYASRVTLKWDPSDRFSARYKLSFNKQRNDGPSANSQYVDCPLGAPQGSTALDNCKADDKTSTGSVGPGLAQFFNAPYIGNGNTYLRQTQLLSGLELNYNLSDNLSLTSVTGYYQLNTRFAGVFSNNFLETQALPRTLLPSFQRLRLRETTQELRLASNFEGPFNFMLGGLFQDSSGKTEYKTAFNAINPRFINNVFFKQDGQAYSAFGQAMFDILPSLELAAGARYSKEKKKLPVALSALGAEPTTLYQIAGPNFSRKRSFDDISPEATLSWRPTQQLTVYGAYKEGFLSGGFAAVAPAGFARPSPGAAPVTNSFSTYEPQETKGFEAGIKALLLDGALRANLTAYSYKTDGLQVTVTTQGTQVDLVNAGSVRTKGAEFDFTYRLPVSGLSINGGGSYLKGTYLDYQAQCYRGQTALSGPPCLLQTNRFTGGTALFSDLSGTQLVRAPKWSGNIGASYETPITGDVKLGVNGSVSFSSGYFSNVSSSPGGYQSSYQLFDASVRLMDSDDSRWELAVIGRNLTDEYYIVRSSDVPFSGTAAAGNATVGTLGDTSAVPSRGREVMLRATIKFGR